MLAAFASSSVGFAPQPMHVAPTASRVAAPAMVSKELEDLAIASNPALKYFDPLGLGTADFWGMGNDATVGWLRHSEIKHGRIAMFAFVGYCVQYNGIHCAFPMEANGPNNQYVEGLTPPEQWDALTPLAKFQILVFIGFLEFWGEFGASPHYTKGGKPGDYPSFPEKNVIPATPIKVFDLFDPFGFSKKRTEEAKSKGLVAELNNGRLAMIGIMGFLTEQKIPGAVPFGPHLKAYAGEVMAPLM